MRWMVHIASYTMLTATWCCSECCVPSGLNFEAAGVSVVHYCLSNYLLRGHRVTVNMTWTLFCGYNKCKRVPGATPLFSKLVRCSAHGCSFARLRYILYMVANFREGFIFAFFVNLQKLKPRNLCCL